MLAFQNSAPCVQDARRTGKQYVQLSILEPLDDSDGGELVTVRTLIFVLLISSECIEFDNIYAPENESELNEQICNRCSHEF